MFYLKHELRVYPPNLRLSYSKQIGRGEIKRTEKPDDKCNASLSIYLLMHSK